MKGSRIIKPTNSEDLDWGPVKVIAGRHKGRIGYLDDIEDRLGVVYFGDFLSSSNYDLIQMRYLEYVTMSDMIERYEILSELLGMFYIKQSNHTYDKDVIIDYLFEYTYIKDLISDKTIKNRFHKGVGKKLFISHSSKDKYFARLLYVDLAENGHQPWLDEWNIKVGQSIIEGITDGLNSCDYIIVLLSDNSIKSKWVEREWHDKYWDEVSSGNVIVIPALIRNCDIPTFLKTKKYADFTSNYNSGLEDILYAIS